MTAKHLEGLTKLGSWTGNERWKSLGCKFLLGFWRAVCTIGIAKKTSKSLKESTIISLSFILWHRRFGNVHLIAIWHALLANMYYIFCFLYKDWWVISRRVVCWSIDLSISSRFWLRRLTFGRCKGSIPMPRTFHPTGRAYSLSRPEGKLGQAECLISKPAFVEMILCSFTLPVGFFSCHLTLSCN